MTHVAGRPFLELGPERNKHSGGRDRFSDEWQTAGLSDKTTSDCPLDLNGEFPWHDDQFDAIYAGHVLEHIAAPRSFLKNCLRVLKPGGVLRIVVPSMPYIISEYTAGRVPLDQVLEWARDYRPLKHRDGYDEQKLRTILEDVGFGALCIFKPFCSLVEVMENPYFSTRPHKSIRCEGVKP